MSRQQDQIEKITALSTEKNELLLFLHKPDQFYFQECYRNDLGRLLKDLEAYVKVLRSLKEKFLKLWDEAHKLKEQLPENIRDTVVIPHDYQTVEEGILALTAQRDALKKRVVYWFQKTVNDAIDARERDIFFADVVFPQVPNHPIILDP